MKRATRGAVRRTLPTRTEPTPIPWPEQPVACPKCGSDEIRFDLACHTFLQATADGERWLAHMTCDTAVYYTCVAEDERGESCSWSYTHGLNPRSPRWEAQEAKRPAWLPEWPGGFLPVRPGVTILGE